MSLDERALLILVAKTMAQSLDTPRTPRLAIQELLRKLERETPEG